MGKPSCLAKSLSLMPLCQSFAKNPYLKGRGVGGEGEEAAAPSPPTPLPRGARGARGRPPRVCAYQAGPLASAYRIIQRVGQERHLPNLSAGSGLRGEAMI